MTRKTGIRWNRIIDPVVSASGVDAAEVSGIVQDTVPGIVVDSIVAGSGIAVEPIDSTVRVSSTVSIPERVESLEGLIDGIPASLRGSITIQIEGSISEGNEYSVSCGDPEDPQVATYVAQAGDTNIEVTRGLMEAIATIVENVLPPWGAVECWEDYENTDLLEQGQFRLYSIINEDNGTGFITPYINPISNSSVQDEVLGEIKGVGITGNVNITDGGLFGITRIYNSTNAVKLIDFENQQTINIGDGSIQVGWPGGTLYTNGSISSGERVNATTFFNGKSIILNGVVTAEVNGAIGRISPTNLTAWNNGLATLVKVTSTGVAIASGLEMPIHSHEGRLAIIHNEGPESLTLVCYPSFTGYHTICNPSGNIVLASGDNLFLTKNNDPEQWLPIGGSYHTNRENHYGPLCLEPKNTDGIPCPAEYTVDLSSILHVAAMGDGDIVELPVPTNPKSGRLLFVVNSGTKKFLISGTTVVPGAGITCEWTGSRWNILNCPPDPVYGEMYIANGSGLLEIPVSEDYNLVTSFTNEGESKNCVIDMDEQNITVQKDGTYRVSVSFSTYADKNNFTLTTSPHKDGVEIPCIHIARKFGSAGDISSGHSVGIVTLSSGNVLDVRTKHDHGEAVTLTPRYGNFAIQRIDN